MKTYRPTIVLIGLFFAALLVVWYLDYAGVQTEAQRRRQADRIVPALVDLPEAAIGRIEIAPHNGKALVFERRGKDQWQMVQPLNVMAEPTAIETLLRNLRDLRRSPDAGSIIDNDESYGFSSPQSVIRLWKGDSAEIPPDAKPIATLELGNKLHDIQYVRPEGVQAIDIIDPGLLGAVDRPLNDWREVNLLPIPTFQISRLSIKRDDQAISVQRAANGRWTMTTPIAAPANGPRIESTLAALSALRVATAPEGFVADDVKDFAPYGLDKPQITVEVLTVADPKTPLVVEIGKQVPDAPGEVYARRASQDDVVRVDAKFLSEIPPDSIPFRDKTVSMIDPASVDRVEVKSPGLTFSLAREGQGWALSQPEAARADTYLVQSLINHLDTLTISEFLSPEMVGNPELDPPLMTLKVWQTAKPNQRAREAASASQEQPPALSLEIGRYDRLKKTVYARLEGDQVILALPDLLLNELPKNRLGFRDREVLVTKPGSINRLTITKNGQTSVLEPDTANATPNQWRMTSPVKARANVQAISQMLALLGDLRCEEFIDDSTTDEAAYGIDHPEITVAWEMEGDDKAAQRGRLRIGKQVQDKPGSHYAMADGFPAIFSLPAESVQSFFAECHDTQVLALDANAIRRLVFRTPDRTAAFTRNVVPRGGPVDWTAEAEADAGPFDLSRFNDLIRQLSQLQTPIFLQYEGPIPAETGLLKPRLTVELQNSEKQTIGALRLGDSHDDVILATTADGTDGPVFYLSATAWEALIESMQSAQKELPEAVFAP